MPIFGARFPTTGVHPAHRPPFSALPHSILDTKYGAPGPVLPFALHCHPLFLFLPLFVAATVRHVRWALLAPQLFHFRESGRREISTFSSGALFVFFVPYTIMACLTYGIAVPSGLFVPSLLSGAAFGEQRGGGERERQRGRGNRSESGGGAQRQADGRFSSSASGSPHEFTALLEAHDL